MSTKLRVGGSWKTAANISVNVGGVWKNAERAYVKTAGVWKQVFKAFVKDTFTRTTTTSLGTSDNGSTWSNLRGTWYANGSQAQSDTNQSDYPIAVIDAESNSALVSANVAGGTGTVFWAQDADNWWAAFSYKVASPYSYNYTYPCTGSCYGCSSSTGCTGLCNNAQPAVPATADTMDCYQTSWCYQNTPAYCGGTYVTGSYWQCSMIVKYSSSGTWQDGGSYQSSTDDTCQGSCSACAPPYPLICTYCMQVTNTAVCLCPCGNATAGSPAVPDTNNCGPCCGYYSCTQSCTGTASGTNYYYYLRVIQSVNGSLTTISDTSFGSNAAAIKVETTSTTYTATAYADTSMTSVLGSTTYTPSTPNAGTKYGIIKAPTSYDQNSVVDNVVIGV